VHQWHVNELAVFLALIKSMPDASLLTPPNPLNPPNPSTHPPVVLLVDSAPHPVQALLRIATVTPH